MLRVLLRWSGLPGGDAVNVLHFTGNSESIAQQATDDLIDLLQTGAGGIAAGVTAVVDPQVVALDPATGNVTNFFAVTSGTFAGTATDKVLPQNAMLLVKFITAGVVNNRRVQGRLFLPGLTIAATVNGEVAPAYATDFQDRFEVLIGAGLVIWSRPTTGRAGSQHPVTGVDVWREWAQLGKRRS